MNSTMDQIKDFLIVGGPVVWILLGFSVVAVTIVLAKTWQLTTLRAESRKSVDAALDAWRNRDIDGALAKLSDKRPVESIVAYSMDALRHANRDVATVREEAERRALNVLHDLRSFLRPMEIIASLSPLLGLLGTVLGMITAFQQMEAAGSQVDPSVLSGGIWQALLTTAVGIAVAIPVVAMHAWLERKVERVAHIMNDAVTQVFTSKEGERLAAVAARGVLHAA
ncbi:MotA/TolQ/ExbB proton channel family protein [Marinomonas fungiae]|uniref:Outer membrane transport energization protein ExbB (TC 2.C.1.1.1) n=1 Tax=Marinomonas fungiae TaxID=1137284 RepID=A0A0K6INF7_9GAMM|nr:MotA/TolQ/ExbB proton channel family protein [Marinomonas fungiae]CUB04645.1 outer membrane transport energization protein ExbB (TC 2.C.1.1.1) [Marinomonas fungiae]